MKNFILLFALLFMVGTQIQANTLTSEPYETITYSIDAPDIGVVQNAHITQSIGENNNHQGQYAYNTPDSGYTASITSSGYCENQYTNKQIDGSTTNYQIQSSNIISQESRKRNSSRMYMRGAPASGETLQGNHSYTKTNYNGSEGNYCADNQRAQLFAKGVFLDRDRVRGPGNCSYCREIYKTLVIPENWFRNITTG